MDGKRFSGTAEDHKNSDEINNTSAYCKYVHNSHVNNPMYKASNIVHNMNAHDDENELYIIYTNADCLTNKRGELKYFLNRLVNKPSIIAITEVNSKLLTNKMLESEFNIEDYNIFIAHVSEAKFRGIIVYVDVNIEASQVNVTSTFDEFILIQIKTINQNNLLFGTF